MPERPAKAVYDVLAAALAGETVRIGHPQDLPDRGVWCLPTGGLGNVPIQGSEDIHRPTVQVFCRAARQAHESLETLTWAAFNAINRNPPTGYTSANCLADPIQLQPDENGRPRASFNVALVLIE